MLYKIWDMLWEKSSAHSFSWSMQNHSVQIYSWNFCKLLTWKENLSNLPATLSFRYTSQNWKIDSGDDNEPRQWSIIYSSQFLIFKSYLHHASGSMVEAPEGRKYRLEGRDVGLQTEKFFPFVAKWKFC